MKTKLTIVLLLLLSTLLDSQLSPAFAQGTAFTYQGRLNDGANPANGSYDLRFILYDNSVSDSQLGPLLTNSATIVSNGLLTVTLDFGFEALTVEALRELRQEKDEELQAVSQKLAGQLKHQDEENAEVFPA